MQKSAREPPRYSLLWDIAITLTVAEIYEEKPFLISGATGENALVTDVGAKEKEKVKEKAKVELEVELGKTDLNVKQKKDGVLHGIEGGRKGDAGDVKGQEGEEKERGPAVVQEGEQPQGAAR